DDVIYKSEYFDKIIAIYSQHNDLDVGLFKIKTPPGEPNYKPYPPSSISLNGIRHHFISSIEITFKISSVRNRVWFDERFGLGSRFLIGGEESVFIHDCKREG